MKDSTFGETSHVGAAGSKESSNKRAHGGLMKGKGPLWAVAGNVKENFGLNLSLNNFTIQETIKITQKEDITMET